MTCPGCGTENKDAAASCSACALPLSLPVGTVLADRYLVESLLGVGGLGRVYRAHDRMLDEEVAVKVLHPEASRSPEMSHRFRSEVKLARKVRHKNVCAIHEYGEHEGLHFVAMELVDGVDLHRILRERGALPVKEAYAVAIEVTRGLVAIHDAGVIHRDLKTPNIMRDVSGGVRLLDFGIAKSLSPSGSLVTAVQKVVGTPEYMSPEQIRGDDLDERSDIYGLGVVIYELCTGEVPFQGKSPLDTLVLQMNTPPPLYGDAAARLPESLLPLLRRCLAKRREDRFRSARDVLEALRAARETALPGAPLTPSNVDPAQGEAPVPPSPAPPPARRATPRPEMLPPIGPPRNPLPGPPPLPAALPAEKQDPADRSVSSPDVIVVPAGESAPSSKGARTSPGVAGLGLALALFGLLAVLAARACREQRTAEGPSGSPTRSSRLEAPVGGPTASAPLALPPEGPAIVPAPGPPDASPPLDEEPTALPTVRARSSSASEKAAREKLTRASATPTPMPMTNPPPTPVPTTGRLEVETTPPAALEIGGRSVGTTSLHALDVPPGKHTLLLVHPDYWPHKRRVQVEPGRALRLTVDLAQEAVPRASAREAPFTTPLGDSPSDPYFDRGLRQMSEGDFQEAVLTLGPAALRLQRAGKEKEQARVELYLGVAFMEMGRLDLARERFERALELDGSLRLPSSGFSAQTRSLFGDVRAAVKARP